MATTRTRASAPEQFLHWTVAASVLLMAATGAVMYVPSLSELVGQRFWVRAIHLAGAIGLVLALAVFGAVARGDGRRLERELTFWQPADWGWMRDPWRVFADRYPEAAPALGRFNAGQKLFAALIAAVLAVLLLSGIPMYWWGWFSAELVARSRDLHLLAALALLALVAGHVYLALLSPYGVFGQAGAGAESETR